MTRGGFNVIQVLQARVGCDKVFGVFYGVSAPLFSTRSIPVPVLSEAGRTCVIRDECVWVWLATILFSQCLSDFNAASAGNRNNRAPAFCSVLYAKDPEDLAALFPWSRDWRCLGGTKASGADTSVWLVLRILGQLLFCRRSSMVQKPDEPSMEYIDRGAVLSFGASSYLAGNAAVH